MTTASRAAGSLVLHLIGRCNLACDHCYMDASPYRREQLPLPRVLDMIGECDILDVRNIGLTGGEPLLYRDLDKVLSAAAGRTGVTVTLSTNAVLLTARHAVRLREYGAQLHVSIDGRPEFHDRFRHLSGAFQAAERGVRHAVAAGVPVSIVSSICQDNLDDLGFLADWAVEVGAAALLAQPLLALGRGSRIGDRCLTFEQVNYLILKLTDLANQPAHRGLRCRVIGASKQFLLEHPCGAFICNGKSCHRRVKREIKRIVVREDGTVFPEVANLHSRYALGNISEGSIATLAARYFESGYDAFDRLCRAAYAEVLPNWDCVLVPWDQIVAARSQVAFPDATEAVAARSCGAVAQYGAAQVAVEPPRQPGPAEALLAT